MRDRVARATGWAARPGRTLISIGSEPWIEAMINRPAVRQIGLFAIIALGGCAAPQPSAEQQAARFIARMDAAPSDERVPNWEHTRSLMLRTAPAVGDAAHDFTLPLADGSARIRLSEFGANRPVVLIFGSWT